MKCNTVCQVILAEINRADWKGGYSASLAHFQQLAQEGQGNISSILEIGEHYTAQLAYITVHPTLQVTCHMPAEHSSGAAFHLVVSTAAQFTFAHVIFEKYFCFKCYYVDLYIEMRM